MSNATTELFPDVLKQCVSKRTRNCGNIDDDKGS